ncbi:sensor histidine kinase [Halorientalis halophila]|uniref:sensor histidine kinase n=1 Tax=Halorientalis halophila TaxID=3108499 RepID=UPI00300AF1D5
MMSLGWIVAGAFVAAVCLVLAGRVARDREHPGAIPFALLLSLVGFSTVAIPVLRTSSRSIGEGSSIYLLLLGGSVFTAILWIAFVFEYTGRGPAITRRRAVGLAGLGCVTIGSTLITWVHEIGKMDLGAIGRVSYLSTFVLQLTVFSLGLLGVFLIARGTLTYDDLSNGRAVVLVSAGTGIALLPLTIGFGQQFGQSTSLAVTFVQLSVIGGIFATLQLRGGLFEPGPTAGHLARETVLDTLERPMVVVDRENRLLDVNVAAKDVFSIDRSAHRDRSLEDVAGITAETDLTDPVSIWTAAGRRDFAVTRNSITDGAETILGRAYRFRDVTDRQTREQRLQVLNRIVRHNLRNDLDAIRGFSETVRDDEIRPDETELYLERIETMANELVELSSAIERSEQLLTEPTLERGRCDLGSVAREVAAESRDREITIDTPDEPVTIRSDRPVLRLILQELVDNAIEHADGENSAAEIEVAQTSDGGIIAVHDEGPGIPEHERAVLLEGEETAVMHSRGIGLWLVYWGTTRLGGRLEFTARDARGSTVTVHLPDLRN